MGGGGGGGKKKKEGGGEKGGKRKRGKFETRNIVTELETGANKITE